jgi:hypothetical protein
VGKILCLVAKRIIPNPRAGTLVFSAHTRRMSNAILPISSHSLSGGGGGSVLPVSFRKPTTKIGNNDIAELVPFFREFPVQCFLGENIKKSKRKKDINATEKGKKER